ncbi:MAG: urate hydroxylase PuuD, partial [Deltaproteobacteria bacterium]
SYRGYVIHTGALFGTIMAANVWMRIWPMQRRIITAVKEGTAPDPAWAALAGARSRHNVYMSVPLVWTMISSHTTTPFASSPVYLLVVILVGWGAVYLLYKKAPKVPGF